MSAYYDSGLRQDGARSVANLNAWADQHARNFFFDELFSSGHLSFLAFLSHVDSFLQGFTLGANDTQGSSRAERHLDPAWCSEALGAATVAQPLAVQAPALPLGVETVRRHDRQEFVLSGGFSIFYGGVDPASGLPRELYCSDQLGYAHHRDTTVAGPVCLEAKQLPHGKKHRFRWPTSSLARAPHGLTWLRGNHSILNGKSGYRYIVSLVQHASNQAPQPPRETSSYFVPTPEQMSASVTWALRFYRVGQQGLDLGREPPSVDDENVAPIFYLNLTYSLGQHYFLDEMFGSSTERFHAVLV
ncbi:hypothetical protein BMF94_3421 [Rhodotorula taiwanensis]|uniref:Uncharacterized protein n=1 Tax=Rhodotorula taiwanensis TaxID=741276 RepID=A0A2S5B9N9_9BASI|nr:hypothetical protein BMF94_3421 [Rhodotorula taiwanensis]